MLPLDVKKRNEYIFNAVKENKISYSWSSITSSYKNHTATFWVTSDAIKVDDVRFTVSALQQQQIADLLNCSLLTPKLADLRYSQADITLDPVFRSITNTTEQMIAQSKAIDAQIKEDVVGKLIDTVGKHWVISDELLDQQSKPRKDKYNFFLSTNYGFHHTAGPSFKGIKSVLCDSKILKNNKPVYVIQSSAQAHNLKHEDYSQNCVLVYNLCEVDGQIMTLKEVLTHPELSYLASHTGPVKILRQPGVEPLDLVDGYFIPSAFKPAVIEFDEPEVVEPVKQEEFDENLGSVDLSDLSDLSDIPDTAKSSNAEIIFEPPAEVVEKIKAQPKLVELIVKLIEFILRLIK